MRAQAGAGSGARVPQCAPAGSESVGAARGRPGEEPDSGLGRLIAIGSCPSRGPRLGLELEAALPGLIRWSLVGWPPSAGGSWALAGARAGLACVRGWPQAGSGGHAESGWAHTHMSPRHPPLSSTTRKRARSGSAEVCSALCSGFKYTCSTHHRSYTQPQHAPVWLWDSFSLLASDASY